MPLCQGLVHCKLAGLPVSAGEPLDPGVRFVVEIVEDRCWRNAAGAGERRRHSVDFVSESFGFLQPPCVALVVVQEAVPMGFGTVGQGTPAEEEQAVRPVGDGVPTPETHLSGFGRGMEIIWVAIQDAADLTAGA